MQLLRRTYNIRRTFTGDDVHQLLLLPPVLVVDVTVPGSARLLVFRSEYLPDLASHEKPTFARARLHKYGSKRDFCTTRTQALITNTMSLIS